MTPLFGIDPEAGPAVLVRISRDDLEHVCAAVGKAINPVGLVIALSDQTSVVVAAGRAARRIDVALLTDPVFFRCALTEGRISQSLARLPYAPPAAHGPWSADDLVEASVRPLVRAVFEAQDGRQRGGWVAPAVALTADPQTVDIAHRLLTTSIATRAAVGREPLIAPLIVDMRAYATLDDQIRLVRALEGVRPEVFLVSLHGAETSADRLAESLRLLLLLASSGVRVLLAKAGRLRAFALALRIGGFETGLGRLERFSLDDFRGTGGPGSLPAKFEISRLLTALAPPLAARTLNSGILGEDPCACDACQEGWRPGDAAGTVLHDASVIDADVKAAIGKQTPARLAELGRTVSAARSMVDDLYEAGVDVLRQTAHLEQWARTLETLKRWGLDAPDAAQRLLDAA
ncbi:MAG: hypothetical protein ACRDLV_08505 [Solirubrobacteraceae bacterium]